MLNEMMQASAATVRSLKGGLMRGILGLGGLMLLAAPQSALAQAVVLVQDDRSVHRVGFYSDIEDAVLNGGPTVNEEFDNLYYPSSPFADWSASGSGQVGSPLHSSTVSTQMMSGSGYAWGDSWAEIYTAGGQTDSVIFDVTFDVLTPVVIDIAGTLGENSSYLGTGLSTFTLSDESGEIYARSTYEPEVELLLQTVLGAGRYNLRATATTTEVDSLSRYDFTAMLTAIPEPSTAILLGVGIWAMGLRRR